MRRPGRPGHIVAPALAASMALLALLLAAASAASAHDVKVTAGFRVAMGWADEPALSGFENSVEVGLTDASGVPVSAPGGALRVEVSSGGMVTTLPLVPAERAGAYGAVLVPTRPGAYTFHISGTVQGRALDATSTCSQRTFDCVTDAAEAQFPVKDPSSGDVARKVAREATRTAEAAHTADRAQTVAIAAIAVAVLTLAVAAGLGMRRRRKGE